MHAMHAHAQIMQTCARTCHDLIGPIALGARNGDPLYSTRRRSRALTLAKSLRCEGRRWRWQKCQLSELDLPTPRPLLLTLLNAFGQPLYWHSKGLASTF